MVARIGRIRPAMRNGARFVSCTTGIFSIACRSSRSRSASAPRNPEQLAASVRKRSSSRSEGLRSPSRRSPCSTTIVRGSLWPIRHSAIARKHQVEGVTAVIQRHRPFQRADGGLPVSGAISCRPQRIPDPPTLLILTQACSANSAALAGLRSSSSGQLVSSQARLFRAKGSSGRRVAIPSRRSNPRREMAFASATRSVPRNSSVMSSSNGSCPGCGKLPAGIVSNCVQRLAEARLSLLVPARARE